MSPPFRIFRRWGPAIAAITAQPWDVTTDSAGNIFIADTYNNRIRRIDAKTGTVATVAGSGSVNPLEGYGRGSYCGDGRPATQACINTPYGIAVAHDGTMYIGENGERIRRVTPDGTITTYFSGGGGRVRLISAGNLFMSPFRIQPNGRAFRFAFTGEPQPGPGAGDGGPASQASGFSGIQDAGEAAAIDTGSAGPGWSRTGNGFKSGGSIAVCRFYGSLSPRPNSHFYTVDPGECANLKQMQAITPTTQKRWNFESLDFASTPPANGSCASVAAPVYRAYYNGFARGIDSNHRITSSATAIQEIVNRGWNYEGVVMCAPN